jgi:hypothetical protein
MNENQSDLSSSPPVKIPVIPIRKESGSPVTRGSFYSFGKDFLAGGIASIGAKTLFAPVDRVKLLLQTQAINSDLTKRYTSPFDCIRRVYHEQGLLSFWRGNLANVYRYFPNQAMNFSFKDRYKTIIFNDTVETLSFLSPVSFYHESSFSDLSHCCCCYTFAFFFFVLSL